MLRKTGVLSRGQAFCLDHRIARWRPQICDKCLRSFRILAGCGDTRDVDDLAATCVGCRRLFGCLALILASVVKGEPEAELSGCAHLSKVASAPSVASATMGLASSVDESDQVGLQPALQVRPQRTMLTVLTQRPAFVSGIWDKVHWTSGIIETELSLGLGTEMASGVTTLSSRSASPNVANA